MAKEHLKGDRLLGRPLQCSLPTSSLQLNVQKHSKHGKLHKKYARKDYFTYTFSFVLRKVFQGKVVLKSVLCGTVGFLFFVLEGVCYYCHFDTTFPYLIINQWMQT